MDPTGDLVPQNDSRLQPDDPPEYDPPPQYGPSPERPPRSGHRRRRPSPPRDAENRREYRYRRLPVDYIRVFQMDQARDIGTEVSGELRIMDMRGDGGPLPYNALSYSWGPTYPDLSHLSESIVCSGRTLRVTPGLKAALKRIRAYGYRREVLPLGRLARGSDEMHEYRHFVVRPLWIDAICIDQNDPDERSQQVLMMGDIYFRSVSVIVWLGEPIQDLWNQLHQFATRHPVDRNPRERRDNGRVGFWSPLRTRREPQPPRPPTAADLCALLRQILQLPWFQRRWVLQEMEFARECDMLIGDFLCSRIEMREMLLECNLLETALPLVPHDPDISLLTACWLYRKSQCSDERDVIYALRQMSPEGRLLHVDYRVSVRTIYLGMLVATILGPREIMEQAGMIELPNPHLPKLLKMLAIASCQRRRPDLNRQGRLEAWMPDWRKPTHFISKNHEAAVDTCMSQLLDEPSDAQHEFYLPQAIDFDRSRYGYLLVRATLLHQVEPYRSRWDRSSLQSTSQERLEKKLASLLPEPKRERDCLWLAYLDDVDLMIGFALRAGSTRATYNDRPVYRMHSCFVIDTERLRHGWTPPDVVERCRRSLTFKVRSGQVFYLE